MNASAKKPSAYGVSDKNQLFDKEARYRVVVRIKDQVAQELSHDPEP